MIFIAAADFRFAFSRCLLFVAYAAAAFFIYAAMLIDAAMPLMLIDCFSPLRLPLFALMPAPPPRCRCFDVTFADAPFSHDALIYAFAFSPITHYAAVIMLSCTCR